MRRRERRARGRAAAVLALIMFPLAGACTGGADDVTATMDAGTDAGHVGDDGASNPTDIADLRDAGAGDAWNDGATASNDPCAGGTFGAASDAGSNASVTGYGAVRLASPSDVPIVGFTTTLQVPVAPPPSGTVFLWPGLQPSPGAANYTPIENGVLQPVLTWGPTCAPNAPASHYASWWVSAQYVNTTGSAPGYTGCQGGPGMAVNVGDSLVMTMTLAGTVWSEKVTDVQTRQSVTFDIDLEGQSQNFAEFYIEGYNQEPTVPVTFTSTVVTFSKPAAASCRPITRGATDSFSAPEASPDGTRCCIASVTLKPQGL